MLKQTFCLSSSMKLAPAHVMICAYSKSVLCVFIAVIQDYNLRD